MFKNGSIDITGTKNILCFLCIFAFALPCYSQNDFDITVFAGLSNYSGELQEKRFTLQQSHFAFGVGLSYRVLPKLSIGTALRVGKSSAHDKFSKRELNRARNLTFYSSIVEWNLTGEYELLDLDYSSWTPFVHTGLAVFHFNPKAPGYGSLRQYSTEGQGIVPGIKQYGLTSVAIPFGGGIKFRINDNIKLGYEITLRKTFTDYIDDVSTTYVDETVLLQNRGQRAVDVAFRSDEISDATYPPQNTLRGSPSSKDWYYYSGFILSFRLVNRGGGMFNRSGTRGSVECPRRF